MKNIHENLTANEGYVPEKNCDSLQCEQKTSFQLRRGRDIMFTFITLVYHV